MASNFRSRALVVGFLTAAIAGPQTAFAQDWGDILGGLIGAGIKAAIIRDAKKSWSKVDQQVQQCLISNFGISPAKLVENGVKATDKRVVPYIQRCEQAIALAKEQQEQERQRLAALEAA